MTVKKANVRRSAARLYPFLTAGIAFIIVKNSESASREALRSLSLCAQTLIPSLFPLTALSELLTLSGALYSVTRILQKPLSRLFGISEQASAPYFLGLIGGYTSSCRSALLLCGNGSISKTDCETVIALSNMPSLAFLCSYIGTGIFKSSTVGWKIWGITVTASVLSGVFNRIFSPKGKASESGRHFQAFSKGSLPLPRATVLAISHSANSMLLICACVVFFSVIIALCEDVLTGLGVSANALKLFSGFFEITRGVNESAALKNESARAVLCSVLSGWSGLCVHFQVISICEGASLSFKRYFILKALQGALCAALGLLVF